MNSLSWLIFFSGVVKSLGNFFIFLTFVTFIVSVIFLIIKSIIIFQLYDDEDRGNKDKINATSNFDKKIGHVLRLSIFSLLFFGIVGNFIPDKNTIIMIAASEFTERVIKSEEVKNIVGPGTELLKAWLEKEKTRIIKELGSSEEKK